MSRFPLIPCTRPSKPPDRHPVPRSWGPAVGEDSVRAPESMLPGDPGGGVAASQ